MRRIRDGLIVFLLGLLLLHGLDWLCGRFWPAGSRAIRERLQHSAYANEPYDVGRLVNEQFQAMGVDVKRRALVFARPFAGDLYNVDEIGASTYRHTVNPGTLGDAQPLILMLGGSTMACDEVADAYTIPSLVSQGLARSDRGRSFVLNAGAQGANSNRNRQRLIWELEHGLRPDWVVLLTGVNEIYEGIYQNRPDGPVPYGELLRRFARKKKRQQLDPDTSRDWSLTRVVSALIPTHLYSIIRTRLADREPEAAPEHILDDARRATLVDRTQKKFVHNIVEMQKLANQHGFRLAVFLQPHVYSAVYDRTSLDVASARKDAERSHPMLERAFADGYPRLQDAIHQLRDQGVSAFDLSHALRGKREPVFLDFCHVTSRGNQRIADEITSRLMSEGVFPVSTGADSAADASSAAPSRGPHASRPGFAPPELPQADRCVFSRARDVPEATVVARELEAGRERRIRTLEGAGPGVGVAAEWDAPAVTLSGEGDVAPAPSPHLFLPWWVESRARIRHLL